MDRYLELKKLIEERISENLQDAITLSDYMADNPEVSAEEFKSSEKIVELLRSRGFDVEYPFCNIPTAFKGVYGSNDHKHKVAILAEYDALPEIGHACGHNISSSISALAAISLKDLQDELDTDIHIFGTPEEEADGAKCRMVDAGAFDGYDLAIMVHLYDRNLVTCKLLAINSFIITFTGKAAHASAAPWEGANALNGAQLAMHAIDMLRQHVTPDVRMHAVYRNGGAAPNVVPEKASFEIFIRALDRAYLNTVIEKVHNCAKGAAIATGTEVDIFENSHQYDDLKYNSEGVEALREVYGELGLDIIDSDDFLFGSSDIGNVSYKCPTFHPTIQLVERETAIHTREFEEKVKSQKAHESLQLGAEIIALDIAKIFTDEKKVARLKK